MTDENAAPEVKPFVFPDFRQGMSLDEKLTKEEYAAFYHEQTSARAYAIVLGAMLENRLTAVVKLLMRRDGPSVDLV